MPLPTAAAESSALPGGENDPRVLAAAGVTVVLWASAFIAIRGAGTSYGPGSMALLRMIVGSIALGLLMARKGFRRPPRASLPLLVTWGVAWFCLYNLALNTAELKVDAGTAAMIVNLAPLMVVICAGVMGEGFPRALVIGAPISFLGVVLIGSRARHGAMEMAGLLLALAAAVLYAGCTIVQKRLLQTVDPAALTWLGASAGAVALLPWTGDLVGDLRAAPLGATLAVVYMGIFPTAIAFTTWAYVLQRSSAGRTSASTYVVPAVVIVMSWAILDETPSPMTLIGGTLCLLGVFITRWTWGRSQGTAAG